MLISGCSSGIGLEAALAFGRRGDRVIAGLRTLANSDALRERVAAESLPIEIRELDVRDAVSVDSAVAAALRDYGAIDALVNNAGIGAIGALEDTEDGVVRRLFEVNVFGLVRLTRAVLPAMRAAGRGAIVNVGSIQGVVPVPFFSVYGASKAAVEAITEALHYEVEPFGLRVVVVEPGRFATAFVGNLVGSGSEASAYRDHARDWYRGWSGIPGRDNPPPVAMVGEAIVRAATDPRCPRHLPVGPDAEPLVERRRALGDPSFETYLRDLTGYHPVARKS